VALTIVSTALTSRWQVSRSASNLCSAISRQADRSVNRGEGLGPVWHDALMLRLGEILIGLICETLRLLGLSVRSNRSIKAKTSFCGASWRFMSSVASGLAGSTA
jgi:hypothetical protein